MLDSKETVIIQNTGRDVLLIKVIPNPKEIEKEFTDLLPLPKNDAILQKMAELQDQLNILKREDLLKMEKESEAREVHYGLPRNLKIAGVTEHPVQEARIQDTLVGRGLRDLFSKNKDIK